MYKQKKKRKRKSSYHSADKWMDELSSFCLHFFNFLVTFVYVLQKTKDAVNSAEERKQFSNENALTFASRLHLRPLEYDGSADGFLLLWV